MTFSILLILLLCHVLKKLFRKPFHGNLICDAATTWGAERKCFWLLTLVTLAHILFCSWDNFIFVSERSSDRSSSGIYLLSSLDSELNFHQLITSEYTCKCAFSCHNKLDFKILLERAIIDCWCLSVWSKINVSFVWSV